MDKKAKTTTYNGPQPRYHLMLTIKKTVGSQALLAKESGIGEWYISRIVRGWLNPSVDQLLSMADAMNVDEPDTLLS